MPVDVVEPAAAPDQPSQWFREPSRREHAIAAGLFCGFGAFFLLLFFVLAGWWFRWVIVGLGVYSILHGLRHGYDVWCPRKPGATGPPSA